MINDYFTIIPEGPNKGKRLYFEDKCSSEEVLPIEIYYLFQNAINNNYNVFYLNCGANHNITIPECDLLFCKKSIKSPLYTLYENYKFSDQTLKLKEFQYEDILQIYNLSIKSKKIGSFFIYPKLDINNRYCFDLFLILNSNFDINIFLNINFNLIKINSFIKYNKFNLTIELMQKLHNLNTAQFKDNIINPENLKKTRPYNLNELPEKIEYDNFIDKHIKYKLKNPKLNLSEWEEKEIILRNNFFLKKRKLFDLNLYKKLMFEKLCFHFYIFDDIIISNSFFFTNFIQLSNSCSIEKIESDFILNYDYLQPYCLSDMFENDDYELFSIFCQIFEWEDK